MVVMGLAKVKHIAAGGGDFPPHRAPQHHRVSMHAGRGIFRSRWDVDQQRGRLGVSIRAVPDVPKSPFRQDDAGCREGIAQMRQQWTLHDEEAMHGQGKHTMVLCRP